MTNQKLKIYTLISVLVIVLLGFCLAPKSFAAIREISIKTIRGVVEYQREYSSTWLPLSKDIILMENDTVRTKDRSSCTLRFKGMSDADVILRPNTVMSLDIVGKRYSDDDTNLDLSIGAILVRADKLKGDSSVKVSTPTSVVGIRGTTFEVEVK